MWLGEPDFGTRPWQRNVADYLRRYRGRASHASYSVWENVFVTRNWPPLQAIIILIAMIAVVSFIVLVERAERRVPVQYAKRVVGRKVMGGQQTHMPLKVNAGGVIPVIFASSMLALPQTLTTLPWVKSNEWLSAILASIAHAEPLYVVVFVASIIFFCFFYVSIIFNPNEARITCGSTADSFPVSGPARARPTILTGF